MNLRKSQKQPVNGVLLFDKPAGIGSNGALKRVKHLLSAAKGGHTGSLDPMATGLLPLCFGKSTKIAGYFLDADKCYRTRVKLGETTDTGDCDGEVTKRREVDFDEGQLREVLGGFIGEQDQIPPMYSAVKVKGQRLYKYARQGIEVERQARRVTVHSLELISFSDTEIDIEVSCSRGFYVRVLAEDIGERLGCGGHVAVLRRIGVGQLSVEHSITLDQIEQIESIEERRQKLIQSDEALSHIPSISLSLDAAYYLCRGQAVRASKLPDNGIVRLYESSIGFIGIGESLGDGRVAPKRLFHTPNKSSQL